MDGFCFWGKNFVEVFTCSLSASRLIHTKIIINDDQDGYDNEEEDKIFLIYQKKKDKRYSNSQPKEESVPSL